MTPELMNKLRERIGPVEGHYLRPFVADGDPTICPVVLLGYNPATPIPEEAIAADAYCKLLLCRSQFEQFYSLWRAKRKSAEGKRHVRALSTTRRRLSLIREALYGDRVVEMNANAWATRNQAQLRRAVPSTFIAGRDSASWAGSIVNPKLVIAYGKKIQIPDTFAEICDLSVRGKAATLHRFVEFYKQASWNGKPIGLAHIRTHLAARDEGVSDGLFSAIGTTIKTAFNSLGRD